MITVNFELNNQPNRMGQYRILMRFTQNRQSKRVAIGVVLDRTTEWNVARQKVTGRSDKEALNAILQNQKLRAESIYTELQLQERATVENLLAAFKVEGNGTSFVKFTEHLINKLEDHKQIRQAKKYQTFLKWLNAYLRNKKRDDLQFAELTYQFVSNFDSYLRTVRIDSNGRCLNPNTVSVNMKIFKTITNKAIEQNQMKAEHNPFNQFKVAGEKPSERQGLSADEIQRIIDLQFEPHTPLWHTKNMFLFSFYCAGIRIGDLLQLRWNNITEDNHIQYTMGKNDKQVKLPLVDAAKEILSEYGWHKSNKSNDYIFPMLSNNEPWAKYATTSAKKCMSTELTERLYAKIESNTARINKTLKRIASLADIPHPLSFHISRHSFARVAIEHGLQETIIQEMLHHTKLSTTRTYTKGIDTACVDKELGALFQSESEQKENNNFATWEIEQLKAFYNSLPLTDKQTVFAQLSPEQRKALNKSA